MSYTLDPQAAALLEAAEASGRPPLESLDPEAARAQFKELTLAVAIAPAPVGKVIDRTVPGPAAPLPVRVYQPESAGGPWPVLVYFHGGGFVLGDLETHDSVCRWVCRKAAVVVVSVDYRLAPEHPFPAALDDSLAAIRWVAGNGAEIGADGARLAVGGDSAGANLSTVAAGILRDEGGPAIRYQLLVYPVTDMAMDTPSHKQLADGYRLTRSLIDWFYSHYLPPGTDSADPRLSPAKADTLAGLPPALVVTAGFDPLRDEGKAYADAMRAAGVAVDYRCYDGMIHGFLHMGGRLDGGRALLDEAAGALKEALA